MASDAPRSPRLEIAHVLFMDLVGYSVLPLEAQPEAQERLQVLVRATRAFRDAEARDELICLPVGDGMALVFRRDPLAPLRCALEIAAALRELPHLQLRMGVHSGPVYVVEDINAHETVAGGGINIAQRVMDCGDAGHILLSSTMAEVLSQLRDWAPSLQDLGECGVKHGVRLHLFNFCHEGAGNPQIPSRLRRPAATDAPATVVAPRVPTEGGCDDLGHGRSEADRARPPHPPAVGTRSPPGGEAGRAAGQHAVPGPSGSSASPTPAVARVALLYKRYAQPDEQVLELLETELRAAGHSVFIDRHLAIGVEWAKEIEREIRTADAVVPLLSPTSVKSEMLGYEVEIAHQSAQEQNGKPRLLPVRVSYTDPLPEETVLPSILDPLEYSLWEGSQDNDRLVGELLNALRAPVASVPAVPIRSLEAVAGAVPLGSPFYVVRDTDDQFHTAIARRDSIALIKGARQMGKTSLLARGLQQAREAGARVVLTDLQMLNAEHLQSADTLLLTLAQWIADDLDLEVPPAEGWNPRRGANMNFRRYLAREVLGRCETPIAWGLDEVDRLFSYGYSSEIFGLFRSCHNARSTEPTAPWSRLTIAMAYATEAHLFITDVNQSPFNVGTRLTLEDFSFEQVADLNQRYGAPLQDEAEIAGYYRLLSGHPYLVRRGLHELTTQGMSLAAFEAQADREEGIFGDHLRRMLVLLAKDAELCEAVRAILKGQPGASPESFYRLRSAGVMSGDSPRNVRPRCQLYATYLERHLL